MAFKPAQKIQSKLKIALTGPSGSGKTYSALLIAKGIGGRIALADTENASASLYSDLVAFDTDTIKPPYTIDKYIEKMADAEKAGYNTLILDSISHAWSGEGGLLELVDTLARSSKSGSKFNGWNKATPLHQKFIAMMLNSNMNLIATMRSKEDYVLQEVNGKQVPKKIGMAPVQRDGMSYEFTLVLDLSLSHHAEASKDRTRLFDDKLFIPSEETGKQLVAWQVSGVADSQISSPLPATSKTLKPVAEPATPDPVVETKSPSEYGDYIAPKGSFAGKKLRDVPVIELQNYIVEIEKFLAGKKASGPLLEMTTAVRAWLGNNEGVKF